MRLLIILVLTTSVFSQTNTTIELYNLLEGKWQRQSKTGITVESWQRAGQRSLEGEGFRIKFENNDTVRIEQMTLTQLSDTLYYVVKIAENPLPVSFKMTAVRRDTLEFQFVNPIHDFPKRIHYRFQTSDYLRVRISELDGSKAIDFYFLKN